MRVGTARCRCVRLGFSMEAAVSSNILHDRFLEIAIVSELRLLRESLKRVLDEDQSIVVTGLFADLNAALIEMSHRQPDMVLLDRTFPSARTVLHDLKAAAPKTLLVVVSVAETPDEVVAWAEAGAAGYIPRTMGLAEIPPLLNRIRHGEQLCTPSIAGALLRRLSNGASAFGQTGQIPCSLPTLTAREKQVAQLIAVGMSNKEIARSLNIGIATTKTHVHHVLGKMNLRRRGQTAKYLRNMSSASDAFSFE
jgi:two-component system, NarL family, nitrate/nitrite response regulator NarL